MHATPVKARAGKIEKEASAKKRKTESQPVTPPTKLTKVDKVKVKKEKVMTTPAQNTPDTTSKNKKKTKKQAEPSKDTLVIRHENEKLPGPEKVS